MTFLRLHFEKLGLGLVLAILVGIIVLVMLGNGRIGNSIADQGSAADTSLKMGKDIEAAATTFTDELVEALTSTKNRFAFVPGPGQSGGSLLEPAGYMRCVNPDCNYLIKDSERYCPFCKAEQPPEMKDAYSQDEDRDQDGIPNYVEDHTPFLNPADRRDADWDPDGDGFTNLEEYRQGTNMGSYASVPPLALNLRIMAEPSRRRMPIKVARTLKRTGTEEAKKWTITLEVYTSNQRRPVVLRLPVGGNIPMFPYAGRAYGPFTLAAARTETQGDGDEAKEVAVITLTSGDDKYEVKEGEFMEELQPSANLVFLGTRERKNQAYIERKLRVTVAKDETFPLVNFRTNQREFYKVKAFTKESVTVEIVSTTGTAGGMGGMGDGMGEGGMQGGIDMPGGAMGGAAMGGGMGMGGEGGVATGSTLAPPAPEKEARVVEFTITRKYDPQSDLLDTPPQQPMRRGPAGGPTNPGVGLRR